MGDGEVKGRQNCFFPWEIGPYPSTAGTFRKKFWKNSGKTPETLSELFLKFPSRVRLGSPKPYDSRHLRLPEHLQNCLPPSTAGGASLFRSGSGEGLSKLLIQFPALLRAFLRNERSRSYKEISQHPNLPWNFVTHGYWKWLKGKNPEGKNFRKLLRRKQSSAKISKISRNTFKTSKSDIFYLLRNLLKYLLRFFFSSAKFSEVFTLCVFTL